MVALGREQHAGVNATLRIHLCKLSRVVMCVTRSLQAETMRQLSSLAAGGWPLDSYIFDMQWHRSPNWGGYEWDGQRYDNVTAMLASMHDMGLFTGMNLHDVARPPFTDPAYSAGVVAVDNPKSWPAFAAAVGVDPSTASVDFNIGNRTYAVALHEVLVTPLLQQGLDMCWYTSRRSRQFSHVKRCMRNPPSTVQDRFSTRIQRSGVSSRSVAHGHSQSLPLLQLHPCLWLARHTPFPIRGTWRPPSHQRFRRRRAAELAVVAIHD